MKSWSRTQTTVALSSGEAEYYSLASAVAEAIGVQSLLKDFGLKSKIKVELDSSAAKSMASRVGIGRTRHLEVKYLWVQQLVRAGTVRLKKIQGANNVSDILTKPKSRTDCATMLARANCTLVEKQ